MSKSKIQVIIAGVTYFLVTDEAESHLQKAATRVEELLSSFKTNVPEATKAEVLVALQLASQVIKLQEEQAHYLAEQKRLVEKVEREYVALLSH